MKSNMRSIGRFYEGEAITFLELKGYQLIDRNVWTAGGEIDLVMEKEGRMYFIEVKYRSTNAFGNPRQSITQKKKSSMTKAAMYYLKKNYSPFSIAFLGIQNNGHSLDFDFIEDIYV